MYSYIKGTVVSKVNDSIILENNGIGYKVFVPLSSLVNFGDIGSEQIVYTHLYVREDIIALYGFSTIEELKMFELLISVSGIGPKAAISVISQIPPSKFGLAVINGDSKTLTNAQGIGNKTAQRIILELKDKMKKQYTNGNFGVENLQTDSNSKKLDDSKSDALNALMVLGYSFAEAEKAISKVFKEGMDTENTVKCALKELSFNK